MPLFGRGDESWLVNDELFSTERPRAWVGGQGGEEIRELDHFLAAMRATRLNYEGTVITISFRVL